MSDNNAPQAAGWYRKGEPRLVPFDYGANDVVDLFHRVTDLRADFGPTGGGCYGIEVWRETAAGVAHDVATPHVLITGSCGPYDIDDDEQIDDDEPDVFTLNLFAATLNLAHPVIYDDTSRMVESVPDARARVSVRGMHNLLAAVADMFDLLDDKGWYVYDSRPGQRTRDGRMPIPCPTCGGVTP